MTKTKEDILLAQINRIEDKLDLCIKDIAGLKVKSSVWGALAGMVPATIALAMWVLSLQ